MRKIDTADFFSKKTARDRITFLLQYAILAPSTHNSQPWLFKINDTCCEIYFEQKAYNIKEADPLRRDLYISFGCLIENLSVAAEYFGVLEDVQYADSNDKNLIATIMFKDLTSVKLPAHQEIRPLMDAILERVNARGLFKKIKVSDTVIERFRRLSHGESIGLHMISSPEKCEQLATLTAQGLREAYRSRPFREEMSTWVNHSLSSRRDGIPGYSLRIPFFISFIFAWILRTKDIGSKVAKLNYMSVASAPLILVFTARNNNQRDWLETGRLAERIMLEARTAHLKTSIFVAAIEIGELYKKVQNIIDTEDTPQLLMCVGEMEFDQKPNLRHPVESKLIQ